MSFAFPTSQSYLDWLRSGLFLVVIACELHLNREDVENSLRLSLSRNLIIVKTYIKFTLDKELHNENLAGMVNTISFSNVCTTIGSHDCT